jgi:hypothetical protein
MEAYGLVNKTKTDFYIVDIVLRDVIERLTRVANVKEGPGLTREEKLKHAVYFVRVQNMPIDKAAKLMAVPPGTVQNILSAAEVEERLQMLGFVDKLYPSVLEALYRIKQDSVLLESAKLVHEAQLTTDETAELARRVSRARSEKNQLAVIEQMRHESRYRRAISRAGQIRQMILPSIQYRRYIDGINRLRPEQVTVDTDVCQKSKSAIKKIEEIIRGAKPE